MDARRFKMIRKAAKVMSEIVESEGTIVVIAVTIAPGIPGDGSKVWSEGRKLIGPVRTIPTDAVQKHQQRSVPNNIHCKAWRWSDIRRARRIGRHCRCSVRGQDRLREPVHFARGL